MPFTFIDVTVAGEGDRPRLDGLSAEIATTGITAITGPSGAGKSTLLRLGNRLIAPDAGRVLFWGGDLAGIGDVLAHRRRVGMVFQKPILFPGTVADNLRTAAPRATRAELEALLERCELSPGLLDRVADTLSGGEAQRACLARTLSTGPQTLLMDEPTSSLDSAATRALERLIRRLADDGVPVLLVSHDAEQVERVADAVLVLDRGRAAG